MMRPRLQMMIAVFVLIALLGPATASAQGPTPEDTDCLYPSPTERFGVTVFTNKPIRLFDVTPIAATKYLDWQATVNPSQPNGMRYYQMVRTIESGYYPTSAVISTIARANPGATWIIGNEADVLWQDNVTPEAYARHYHDVYTLIKSIDPTARFVINGVVQVSRLRLAWLDRVLNTYRTLYGTDIPVDVWNIHTYVANEMHQQWGFEIPPGIPNAVGYSIQYGTQWRQASDAGASGGTVHESSTTGANAWFAFRGNEVTLFFRTGPSSGIAEIFLDRATTPVAEVDLYAATPGTISRRYTNLPVDPGQLGDRHNIRARVTGRKNVASGGVWVRVDAIQAPSTSSLPNGRFEDNDPLRARIVTDVDDHDNLDQIVQQVRDFRQWLVDRGQRNKPLIDTEYGILMTADIGFDYPRVRTFMLGSFDRFLNDLVDPNLGYPEDGNRLLQEWFWFALSVDQFEGRVSNSGLYNEQTYTIKPLGLDYAGFVAPLKRDYRDLEANTLQLTPTWALFAGDPSLVAVKAVVRNIGNAPVGPSQAVVRTGNGALITTWDVPGLAKRFEAGHTHEMNYVWQSVISGNRTVRLIVDEADQIVEPCGNANNTRQLQLVAPTSTDLVLSNPSTIPQLLPPIPAGTTATVTLKVDLANLGGVGTAAQQIIVKFWHGDPAAGGTLIGSRSLTRGNVSLPATVSVPWPNRGPGVYDVYVTVDPVPEESNLQNNRVSFRFTQPAGVSFLPFVPDRSRNTSEDSAPVGRGQSSEAPAWWLP